MRHIVRVGLPLIFLLMVASGAWAEERFPPPDFTSHVLPATEQPSPHGAGHEYIDLVALLVGLALASYFALVRRSRRGLFLLAVVSVIWFGFRREGCICSVGAIQNVALAMFDTSYAIPITAVAFFVLPLLFTLFFGRTFCASICPLGAIQEVVAIRSIKVPAWLEHTLGLVPFLYLGIAVLYAASGTAFVICRYDPFVAFFRMNGSANMLVFGGCLLLIGVFVGRPYCRYLCPYGAILGLLSKISKWHLRIPPEECIQCRLCEDACPYGAIQTPTKPLPANYNRAAERKRLLLMLLLLPLLLLVGFGVGRQLRVPLSRLDPTVRLAEQVHQEEVDKTVEATDASKAFRNTGQTVAKLNTEAHLRRAMYGRYGGWLGLWFGLVFGVKLIHLSIHRRRSDYEPNPTNCVSCGRCFWYCPHDEQARQELLSPEQLTSQEA